MMYIDQFKQPDGCYVYEGCTYDTPEETYQTGIFGMCGCGMPERNLKYIRDGLRYIKEYLDKPYSADRIVKAFGSDEGGYFFFYWATKEDLAEHGGSVPGWLTDRGDSVLSDLNQLNLDEE